MILQSFMDGEIMRYNYGQIYQIIHAPTISVMGTIIYYRHSSSL